MQLGGLMGFIPNSMLNPMPQVDLDPQTVLADYELAIRNSVSIIWPCTVVCGYLFHFEQAMLRSAASMGLAPFYKIIGSPVRRTIQLLRPPFLPHLL